MKKINIQLLAGMVSLFALSAHADLPYHFSAGDVIYADDVNDILAPYRNTLTTVLHLVTFIM